MSCFLVPSPSHPGMFKYAVMPRVIMGYNYAAGPATTPAAVPMTRFPRQPSPALTTAPTTTAFHQNTNPVLTAAVPGQPPAQFGPPFTPAQTLLAAGPPFTRAVRPPPFHKPTVPGKGLKRKLDDMKDKGSSGKSAGQYTGQNLYCKVCCVTLNAPLQAKQHFEGKNHAKKLKMFTDEKSSGDKSEDKGKQASKSDAAAATPPPSTPVTTPTTGPGTAATTTATALPTVPTTGVATAITPATTTSDTTHSVKSTDTKPSSQPTDKKDVKKTAVTKQSPSTKAELNPEIYCKICGVSFNSPKQAQQHYQGKNHSKRVRAANNAAANNKVETPPGITKQGSKFICVVCDIQVTSQAQLDNHLKGTRHQAQRQMAHRSSKTLKGRWGDIKYAALNRLLCGSNFYYSKL